jgi:hypothetical protein
MPELRDALIDILHRYRVLEIRTADAADQILNAIFEENAKKKERQRE